MHVGMVTGTLGPVLPPTPPAAKQTRWGEPFELDVGDLCIWTGKPTEHAMMFRRVIYQVVEKTPATGASYSKNNYSFIVAFDFENPLGKSMVPVNHMGTREMKKLSLLDLATLRLHYDSFITDWARRMGERDPNDVR